MMCSSSGGNTSATHAERDATDGPPRGNSTTSLPCSLSPTSSIMAAWACVPTSLTRVPRRVSGGRYEQRTALQEPPAAPLGPRQRPCITNRVPVAGTVKSTFLCPGRRQTRGPCVSFLGIRMLPRWPWLAGPPRVWPPWHACAGTRRFGARSGRPRRARMRPPRRYRW